MVQTIKPTKYENKPWLDQPSEHHKVVITVLIHTWNEHLNIQLNKNKARYLYA